MILDKITNLNRYAGISPNLDAAIRYLQKADLQEIPAGESAIDGDAIISTVVDHVLAGAPDFWEVHRKYIDIHIVICGSEVIRFARDKEAIWSTKPYDEISDSSVVKNEIADGEELHLYPGDAAVLFPGELHQTNCPCNGGSRVRKVILKVLENSAAAV